MAAKHRSPAYPSIPLPEAIELAKKLYPQASKHPVGAEVVAELWGYKSVSSASPYIAAVKQFGLLTEKKSGSDRMLQLSGFAKDIAVDETGETREAINAMKKAALSPTIYAQMWEKWGNELPPDSEMRRHLERDREFNPKHVGRVVSNYRATLEFAKLVGNEAHDDDDDFRVDDPSEVDTPNNGKGPKVPPSAVQVGSSVQWVSQGVHQFQQPRKVVGLDNDWAFVEGSPTGIKMSELTVIEQPGKPAATLPPPVNPFYQSHQDDDEKGREGIALDRTTLDEGTVRLEWPDSLSSDSVEEFQDWMLSRINRARRKAGMSKIKVSEEQ